MTGSVSSYFVGVKGGLVMSMIAFSIVFLVIFGLMFIMISTKYLAAAIEAKGKNGGGDGGNNVGAGVPQQASAPTAPVQATAVPASEDEGELMAVISAAISAMCGTAARVVAFSPAAKTPAPTNWKFVARISNTEGFQD